MFLLLSLGADRSPATDAQRLTPLHQACRAGRLDIASALLKAGADPNAEDSAGNTAAMAVLAGGKWGGARELMAQMGNVKRANRDGYTVRVAAHVKSGHRHGLAAWTALPAKASPLTLSAIQTSPQMMHMAAKGGDVDAVISLSSEWGFDPGHATGALPAQAHTHCPQHGP